MMDRPFIASDWYWSIPGDETRVYSSARGMYVPITDTTYLEWLNAGNTPTRIDSEESLGGVLAQHGMRPQNASTLEAVFLAHKVDTMDALLFKVALAHENRVRVLEGKPEITAAQFRNALKAMI